jgi:DNA-binding CsgD family transcriptional regulator
MHTAAAGLSARALRLAIDLQHIASNADSTCQRAEAIIVTLRRLLPFEAARISVLHPDRHQLIPLATYRHDDPLRDYLATRTATEEMELLGLNRSNRPMCLRDLPVNPRQLHVWREHLWPAGYREGVSVGLFTRDGRHLGVLGLNTDTAAYPTDAARDIIGRVAQVIAHALDPLQTIGVAARIVRDATAGIVLTRAGNVLPLPGLPPHPLLATGSAVLEAVAERLNSGRVYSSFLSLHPSSDSADRHVRVTVLACPPQPVYDISAAVLISPPGNLRGLTPRELQIIGLIIDGWTNSQIAAALTIAERTVATHMEHVLSKLDAPTRALAAVRALRYGVYVPRPLNGVGLSPST